MRFSPSCAGGGCCGGGTPGELPATLYGIACFRWGCELCSTYGEIEAVYDSENERWSGIVTPLRPGGCTTEVLSFRLTYDSDSGEFTWEDDGGVGDWQIYPADFSDAAGPLLMTVTANAAHTSTRYSTLVCESSYPGCDCGEHAAMEVNIWDDEGDVTIDCDP